MRTKATKPALEEAAQVAALTLDCVEECRAQHPIHPDMIQKSFLKLYEENDLNLVAEMQGHLAEKSDTFTYMSVTAMSNLVKDHVASSNDQTAAKASFEVNVAASDLATAEYNLILEKATHDQKLIAQYLDKVRFLESQEQPKKQNNKHHQQQQQ